MSLRIMMVRAVNLRQYKWVLQMLENGRESSGGAGAACLHGDQAVVDLDLLGQEIGSYRGLVLATELLVDILVHEGRLAHPAAG